MSIEIEATAEVIPARGKAPRKQVVVARMYDRDGQPFATRRAIALWDDAPALAVGRYRLAANSVFPDRFDGFGFSPRWTPVVDGAGK